MRLIFHLKKLTFANETHFKPGTVERRRRQVERESFVPNVIGIRLFRKIRFLLLDSLSVLNQVELDVNVLELQVFRFHHDDC